LNDGPDGSAFVVATGRIVFVPKTEHCAAQKSHLLIDITTGLAQHQIQAQAGALGIRQIAVAAT